MPNPFRYKNLYLSMFYFRTRRFDKAKHYADLCPEQTGEDYVFFKPYLATVLTKLNFHEEAYEMFREEIDRWKTRHNIDAQYILNYCRFYVALYDRDESAKASKAEALKLSPSEKIRDYLKFPDDDQVLAVLSDQTENSERRD